MKKINYAIQVGDKFVEFFWDAVMEWETLFKEDLNENNISNILFEDMESATNRLSELIRDLNEYGDLDFIEKNDIDSLKVVKIELNFDYKVLD